MKRIFVSHPYKANPKTNKEKVDKICKEIIEQGYLPISPLHLFGFIEQEGMEIRRNILNFCMDLIVSCDEVWIYGDSEGCRMEKEFAEEIGKPIKVKGAE